MPHQPQAPPSFSSRASTSYWIGDWHVEPLRLRIGTTSGEPKLVEPKMMLVLLLLIENQGAVVSREELLSEVWPGVIVSDDSLSRCISRLRKIFQGASTKVEIIETVRGRGYRLAHESRLEAGEKSYHVQTNSDVPSTDSRALILGRAILILGVFFIVFSLGWMSSAYFGTPLIVYRDSDMIGSVGVILDSLFTGEISSSEMAFYTTGKLKSD